MSINKSQSMNEIANNKLSIKMSKSFTDFQLLNLHGEQKILSHYIKLNKMFLLHFLFSLSHFSFRSGLIV